MKVTEFINKYKTSNVINTKVNPNATSDFIKKTLEVREYVPFRVKQQAVQTVVQTCTSEVDGVKKNDTISQYVSFVIAMLTLHTNLDCDEPIDDYDTLCEAGLLNPIIETFITDYNECEALLKMSVAAELEDNNINVLVGKFLNKIVDFMSGLNLKDLFGVSEEDLSLLKGFIDREK